MSAAIVEQNNKMVSVHFESMCDFFEHVPTGVNQKFFNKFTRRESFESSSWIGPTNKTIGDVIDHALTGDPDLYGILKGKFHELNDFLGVDKMDYIQKVKSSKRKVRHGRIGDEIDIHKVYAGNLDTAWRYSERETIDKDHGLVTIFINISGLSSVDCNSSLWRSVVAMKLYEDLERAGKSVRIIVGGVSYGTFTNSRRECACSIVVKEYDQQLNVERLAAMSHIGFYRVFGFAAKAAQSVNRLHKGMGYSKDINSSNVPINLQKEIEAGHTKLVIVDKCTSLNQAARNVARIQATINAS